MEQAETGQPEGQSAEGLERTTQVEPNGLEGQSEHTTQTTGNGPDDGESTFFDVNALPPELMPAYKQMQAAFTKKSQSIAEHRQKIEAYDQFMQNPAANIQQLAQQYGYQLLQGSSDKGTEEFNPQTWDEVLSQAEQRAEQRVLKRLEPFIGEVKQLKEKTTESYLDSRYPDWRTYEDNMRDTIKKHPTMAQDLDLLYEMSLPPNVRNSRATKTALNKLKANTEGAQVSGNSTVNKEVSKTPSGKLSFDQAVQVAKQRIAKGGI